MEGVKVHTDGDRRFYSDEHPSRMVLELLFGNFALYERHGDDAVRVGVGDQTAAFQWLNGEPQSEIEIFKVEETA